MFLWMDSGGDDYTTAQIGRIWTSTLNPTVAAEGPNGRRCLRVEHSFAIPFFQKTLPAVGSEFYVSCRAQVPSNSGWIGLAIMTGGSTFQLCVTVNTGTGQLQVRRGTNTGTILGSAPLGNVVNFGTFYQIALTGVLHGSTGSFDLILNGVVVLSMTGVNTANSGTSWDAVRFGANTHTGGAFFRFLDIFVADGQAGEIVAPVNVGDVQVTVRKVLSEGNYAQSAPSSGSDRAAMVDEDQANDDTDYNTLAVNDIDTFNMTPAIEAGRSVLALQWRTTARKTDAGAGSIRPKLRHGGIDYNGAAQAAATTYSPVYEQGYEQHPNGSALTTTNVNATEVGYERTE